MEPAFSFAVRGLPPELVDPRELLDLAYDAVLVRTFAERRIVFWNRGATGLYGFGQEDALGRIPGDLLQTVYPIPLEEIERTIAQTGRWEGILTQRSRQGRILTVNGRWALSRDGEGRPSAILEINSDITERQRAEFRLGMSEERFRLLVEAVEDYAIFMLDTRGYIESWNAGAARIKGYTAEEAIGHHFSIFYPPEDIEAGKPSRELQVALAEGRVEDEGWRLRKDGTRFWANVVITALFDPEGRLRGFGKVTRDLSERRQAQDQILELRTREAEQLRHQARDMKELERAKTRLLNLASHELRGPLAVIRGYVSMLADGSISPEYFRGLAPTLLAKATQMNTLVQQMLETARLEDSRMQLNRRPVDLVRLVRHAVGELTPLLPQGQRIEVRAEARVVVDVDEDRVHTIVTNLLDNAIKYSLGRGEISCVVETIDHQARLCVRDHGTGITAAGMQRLFGRFERIVTDDNQHIPGTGLGLHLARELARLHGGELTASSTPGQGSEFVLTLPLVKVSD